MDIMLHVHSPNARLCGTFGASLPTDGTLWNSPAAYRVGSTVPAVFSVDGERHLRGAQFGLPPSDGTKPVHAARRETAFDDPAFAEARTARRAVVLADVIYLGGDERNRQPFSRRDRSVMGLAALLCSRGDLHHAVVLTRPSDDVVAKVVGRMPVVLSDADYGAWIDGGEEAWERAVAIASADRAPRLEAMF